MTLIKGYNINVPTIRDSASRRALRFKNNIISTLRSIGIPEDDIEIDLEPIAIKRLPATATWYLEGFRMQYTYKIRPKYVENMYVVSKIIELEVKSILNGKKTTDEFINDFVEDYDVEEERIAARELIGVENDCNDMQEINKKYKLLAKESHPDMETGDTEKFKALNHAHKILKRELE